MNVTAKTAFGERRAPLYHAVRQSRPSQALTQLSRIICTAASMRKWEEIYKTPVTDGSELHKTTGLFELWLEQLCETNEGLSMEKRATYAAPEIWRLMCNIRDDLNYDNPFDKQTFTIMLTELIRCIIYSELVQDILWLWNKVLVLDGFPTTQNFYPFECLRLALEKTIGPDAGIPRYKALKLMRKIRELTDPTYSTVPNNAYEWLFEQAFRGVPIKKLIDDAVSPLLATESEPVLNECTKAMAAVAYFGANIATFGDFLKKQPLRAGVCLSALMDKPPSVLCDYFGRKVQSIHFHLHSNAREIAGMEDLSPTTAQNKIEEVCSKAAERWLNNIGQTADRLKSGEKIIFSYPV